MEYCEALFAVVEELLRALSVVHVEVDDEHSESAGIAPQWRVNPHKHTPVRARELSRLSRMSDRVEDTVSIRDRCLCMMPGRTHQRECIRDLQSLSSSHTNTTDAS